MAYQENKYYKAWYKKTYFGFNPMQDIEAGLDEWLIFDNWPTIWERLEKGSPVSFIISLVGHEPLSDIFFIFNWGKESIREVFRK